MQECEFCLYEPLEKVVFTKGIIHVVRTQNFSKT